MQRKIIPQSDIQQIISIYQSGKGSDAIATQFSIHPNTVLKILKKNNIERRDPVRKIPKTEIPTIIKLYQEGLSMPKLAEKYGVTPTIISRILDKNNIESRNASECHRRFPFNENFFDVIDTQEKAYILGFIYADGCNQQTANTISMNLHQQDIDILKKMAACLFPEHPEERVKIYTRIRKTGKEQTEKEFHHCSLNFNSKYMCQKLTELGCEPRKSLTIKFPDWLIDANLQRHFIRGYYDGDGGIQINYKKQRGAKATIIGTKNFTSKIIEIVTTATNINFYIENVKDITELNRIVVSGNQQSYTFLKWLYQDATIYMDRKYNKFLELKQILEENNKLIQAGIQGYQKRYLIDL